MSKHSSRRIAARQAELARRKRRHAHAPQEAPEPELGEAQGEPVAASAQASEEAATAQPGALPEFRARGRGQAAGRPFSSKPVAANVYFMQDVRLIGALSVLMLAVLIVLTFVIK